MQEPLGYNVLNATKGLWLTADGDWSRSYYDAEEFADLEQANEEMRKADAYTPDDDTFYVLACMPSP